MSSKSSPAALASLSTRGPSRRARPGSRRRARRRRRRTTSLSGLEMICGWLEVVPGNLHQPGKGTAVAHGQVSQHLAVDLHSGLAKAVHQLVVGQPRLPRGGVDPRDPKLPHLALAAAPVAERVRERVQHRLVGGAEQQLLGKSEALGPLEDPLVAAMRGYAALDSCHLETRSPAPGGPLCGRPWPRAALCGLCACESSTSGGGGGSSRSCGALSSRCASRGRASLCLFGS